MTNEKPNDSGTYAGQKKMSAAAQGFLSEFAIWSGIAIAVEVLVGKLFKQNATSSLMEWAQGNGWKWDLGIGAVFGALGGFAAYSKAEQAENQHDQLVKENTQLKQQMAKTGEALTRVGLGIQQAGAGFTDKIQSRGSHAEALQNEAPSELAR